MSRRFPEYSDGYVDPWQDSDKGREYEGAYPLADLGRLTPLLASSEGEAAFALRFGRDDEERTVISGRVTADLSLICQRCLQPMGLAVRSVVALGPVRGLEESARLPETLDPLLIEEDRVRLRDIVEDELLMAVPAVARHDEIECRPLVEPSCSDRSAEQRAENPFAVLASLKKSSDHGTQ